MITVRKITKTVALIFLSAALSITPVSANSPSDTTLDYMAENHAYFYNPAGTNAECISGSLRNYANSQVLTAKQWDMARGYSGRYSSIVSKLLSDYAEGKPYGIQTDIPWRIFAALHFVEASLLLENPAGGRGIFGSEPYYPYSGAWGTGPLDMSVDDNGDTEFDRQIKSLARRIDALALSYKLDLSNPDDVKKLFFLINGTPTEYIEKALKMDFTQDEAENGEGSVYVMNRYDAKRDPVRNKREMSRWWPGMYGPDGKWIEGDYEKDPTIGTTETFGVFTVYEAMGGTGICTSTSGSHGSGIGIGTGGVISGGGIVVDGGVKSLEEAHTFVDDYSSELCYMFSDNCLGQVEPGGNCVSFVVYFLNRYTTLGIVNVGDGKNVVRDLANNHNVPTGDWQNGGIRPWSVFSWSDPGYGHTGIVLGVDEENDILYLGQMSYYASINSHKTDNYIAVSLSNWQASYPGATFAYFESYLKK